MRFLLTLVLSCLLLSGCGSSEPADNSDGSKKYSIAVIPKGTTHDFWKSVHYGAEQAARDLEKEYPGVKIEIKWQGPSDEKQKVEQRKIVETFIGNEVSGIVLAPIDRDMFVAVVKQAKQRNIPTVIFDSGLSDHSDVVSYVATDNKQGGVMAGEHMAKLLDGQGGVIMLRYQAGSESTEQREAGFLEVMEKHADITVLSENQRVDSNADQALKIGESLLRNHKDAVSGVFTVCEPNNKGMLQGLKNEQLAGQVKFIAFDTDPAIVEGLKANQVHGVVLQDPVKMGYEAVKTMVAHLEGKEVEKRISTGEHLATPDNMDDSKIAELLAPKQFED